jgi:hypothetical protein
MPRSSANDPKTVTAPLPSNKHDPKTVTPSLPSNKHMGLKGAPVHKVIVIQSATTACTNKGPNAARMLSAACNARHGRATINNMEATKVTFFPLHVGHITLHHGSLLPHLCMQQQPSTDTNAATGFMPALNEIPGVPSLPTPGRMKQDETSLLRTPTSPCRIKSRGLSPHQHPQALLKVTGMK